jgi:NTP pyrophosphatase (non-canonical NTP hydrolase)
MNDKEILIKATMIWGEESQIGMMQEESAEVIQILNKWRRGIAKTEDICSELADLEIMLDQMSLIFPVEKIKEAKAFKLKRLADRIKKIVIKK